MAATRGHILKRAKGSWTIVLNQGVNPSTGKRRQRWISVKGPRRAAEQQLTELLHELDTGGFVRPSKVTLADFLRQWLDTYASTNVGPKTLDGYRGIIERQLIPKLGRIVLTELQPSHLQKYYAQALTDGRVDNKRGGLSPRTVLSHHRLLNEALSHGVRWGLLARNVALAVDPPRPRRPETPTLAADGVRRLLDVARDTPIYPVVHLAAFTGLRRSELLGLRWLDLDLTLGTLSVVQVMHRLRDGRVVFGEPKSAKGRRLLPLGPTAILALKAHRERQEAAFDLLGIPLADDSLVFTREDGSVLFPDTVTHGFRRIARKAGVKARFHDLRHAHASLMLSQGTHPKVVSERMGHSTIAITLDTYSHVLPGLQELAVMAFEKTLAPAPVPIPVR